MRRLPDCGNRIFDAGTIDYDGGSDAFRSFHLAAPFTHRNDPDASSRHDADEFQSNRTTADDDSRVARADSGLFDASQNTSKGLDEGGIQKRKVGGNLHHVLVQNPSGNQVVLRICAVVENEVLAKIRPVFQTEVAFVAGSRVRGDDAHARTKSVTHRLARFLDNAGQFVAEQSRGRNHARVVTLFPYFEVRPASQRNLHANEKVSGAD